MRRTLILIVLLILTGIANYHFYASDNYKNWVNRKSALQDKLGELSNVYGTELNKYTDYFYKITNDEIKEEDFEKHDFKSNYSGGESAFVKFVVVNNTNGKIFWDYWALADLDIYNGSKTQADKNIEGYIKKISSVYNKDEVQSIIVYYWLDKRDISAQYIVNDINLKINVARKNIELLAVLIVAASLYLISLFIHIKKFGMKKFLKDIKNDSMGLKDKIDFVIGKLSFEGPYKKLVILFIVTMIFYLLVAFETKSTGGGFFYFLKKVTLLKEPSVIWFMLFLLITFLLALKKLKYFNYILKCTDKISKGDLQFEVKMQKSIMRRTRDLQNIIGWIKEILIIKRIFICYIILCTGHVQN